MGHNTHAPHSAPHPTASRIDRNNRIDATDVGFCEFDNIGCIFDSNMDGIGIQYDISFGMCIILSLFCFSFVLARTSGHIVCFNTEENFFEHDKFNEFKEKSKRI